MSNKSDGNQNPQSAKVVKLGLNISVTGDPDADFEIVLDDKEQKAFQSSSPKEEQVQCSDVLQLEGITTTDSPKDELEKTKTQEVTHSQPMGKHRKSLKVTKSLEPGKMSGSESGENSSPQETSIISKIKSTMEHFEKFSDHIKDIPRLRNRPLATSTPFSDKHNSKSESNLAQSEHRPRKFSHLYDFHCRRDYFKSCVRPSPPDLFLKPLPGEDYYYKRGIYTRFLDFEPYRHYGSDISLNKTSEHGKMHGVERYEGCGLLPEPPSGILKKSDSESGDRQSTSSADSIKDIKIYQSGGILIMQNFKENMDAAEKKEMSEFSAKLIENCNKLKMEVSGWPEGSLPEEGKNSGKMVQFDLSSVEGPKSKSGDSSFNQMKDESSGRMESSESTSDCMKNKDTSPQGTSQSQDLTSLSTQENDSFMSNPPGMSPTYASSKKLEWDSGADVGYLNLDLTKENLSTIEKIVLKGLSSDGLTEENIVYEKRSRPNSRSRSKLTLDSTDGGDAKENSAKSNEGKPVAEKEKETKSGDCPRGEGEGKKKRGGSSPGENCIGERRSKFEIEDSKSETKAPTKEVSATKVTDTQPEEKPLEFTDKSVNVNTLFENLDWQTPPHRRISGESHPTPTHRKHSPKAKVPKSKSRPSCQRVLRTPKKPTQITGPLVTSYFHMGNPKKVYKKVEASPVLNEAELSRDVEEIIVDQRFKIKNVTSGGREAAKEPEAPVKDKPESGGKEAKTKARPISASSSSNNTVLPKSDNGENVEGKTKKTSFTDQIIQTSDYDRESVGVQAFASQVSSDFDFKSSGKKPKKQKTKTDRENVNTSSKNIQAFGLNSSLPKQLEHPTGTEVMDNQNTKSTQFFGGPLNSLPNYHSNLVTKPVESCGRAPNVLKMKRNPDKIRVKEENEKNILANDAAKPIEHSEGLNENNNENKENLITQTSSNSKSSGKNCGGSEKRESERASGKRKTKSTSVEGSDDVSSLVLTSEALKEHGDRIDRNIIQEKYFQSQLVELEKREMISRSTSMDMQFRLESDKEYATTGCQYSPQSRGTTSGGQDPEEDSCKGNSNAKARKNGSSEQYALPEYESPKVGEEGFGKSVNQDHNFETGDSLPSSTQTAHSWVPGMQNSRENSNGVGKARSFEYLPGHIYESSGNLREELPSETEQHLITSCSSDSDTARGTVSNNGGRDSEGRNTLILENSTDDSRESDDRLKILDRALEQLNSTVLKLWEKDGEVQSITQSLLANVCVKSGSGDWLPLAGGDTSKAEEVGDVTDEVRVVATLPKLTSKDANENEYSIACQTEEKSPPSDPEKFFEERKALEKRISEEKKCQIKWIENEIHHLNVLRELLERQSSPVQRKKKRSVLSVASNDTSKSEENYQKNICPRPVTPVYGCTISLSENVPPECSRPSSEQSREREVCPPQYGVAVSLSGCSKNWRRVVMLPVGVQVSLKDPDTTDNCNGERNISGTRRSSVNGDQKALMRKECSQSNVQTQYPSTRRPPNMPCTSVQTDVHSPTRSNTKEHCFCLNLSEKSYSSSKSKTFERRDSAKLNFINEECSTENGNKTSNSTDPEFLELENDPISQSDKVATKNANEPSDLTDRYAKSKSVQSTNCRCQNCPKRVSSTVGRTGSSRAPCQASIHVQCNKSEELGTCRCSRIQVQKSANCTCHIIKIHGSRCCSADRNSCGRESVEKRTENQSCQTEPGPIMTKELIEYPEIAKVTEGPQVKNPCEVKVAYEKREPVLEKLACETKVSYEMVHPSADNSQMSSLERREAIPVTVNTAASSCSCRKKAEKQKTKADDHPRHYFLRIEEAEIDDSSEPAEEKKSLEVVTVTVPVKRAGRSKMYGSNVRQTRDPPQGNVRGQDVPSKGCSCRAESAQHRRKVSQDYYPLSYQRTRAEKPESPIRPVLSPECSYEDVSFYSNQPSKEYCGQEYYPDRSVPQPDSSYSGKPVNGYHESQCCESCSCLSRKTPPSKEVQKEYDSHKKRRGGNAKEYYDSENARFYEDRNNRGRYDGGGMLAWSSDSMHSRGQGVSQLESDRHNQEFYNYNKREFMTKSELLKEEEERRKVQQPSLQEFLSSNRPDFYNSAERRRQIIAERTKERVQKHNNRMDCLMKMIQRCNQNEQPAGSKRIFTTVQMREQTMKRYRKLPEVTGKIADERKKEEYRTNRLMADIFAKKLQIEALKGHINLSNSVSVLYTI